MANARPFLYGLKPISEYKSPRSLKDKNQLESLSNQFFNALNRHDYSNPIFQEIHPADVSDKLLDESILEINGLPKCDGLRRGLADVMASHYVLLKNFPKFKIVVDEVLVYVDEKFTLADVMVLFRTDGLPVGRNGEGGLCVLRWMRDGRCGEWIVRDGMHMQGSNGF